MFVERYRVLSALLMVGLIFAPFMGRPVAAAPLSPLDLTTDEDRDGVADALAEAVQAVADSSDSAAAIQALEGRLPYSPQTRQLQARAAGLVQRMATVKSTAEARRIQAELESIALQMVKDPAYDAALASLEKLYLQRGVLPGPTREAGPSASWADWAALRPGDVLLIRQGVFHWSILIYTMWYSHSGTYHGSNLVLESNEDGVRLKPLSRWQAGGQYVAFGRTPLKPAAALAEAQTWAENLYGSDGRTPYNFWFPDKLIDSRVYCSQLVWKIYQHAGVDLDSNAWEYHLWLALKWGAWVVPAAGVPGVAPDEIGLDTDLNFYFKGWN